MKKIIIRKIINSLVLVKHSNYIYVSPHENCFADKYDLINYTGDNSLTLVNYFLKNHNDKKIKIFLENNTTRFKQIYEYIYSFNNKKVKIKLLKSDKLAKNNIHRLLIRFFNSIRQYKCRLWINDTQSCNMAEKKRGQTVICCNYSTPLKSGPKDIRPEDLRFIDYDIETSPFSAEAHSKIFCFPLSKIKTIGFARNDNLNKSEKLELVRKWIDSKVSFKYKYIFVYAPTYRDYPNAYSSGHIFGYKDNPDILEDFLKKNDILVIYKFHPLQDKSLINKSNHLLEYEKNADFSLYDLLSLSDCLISDYSSVIHDYLLTDKPILLACFDSSRYESTRGFAFYPLEDYMPTDFCETSNQLIKKMSEVITNNKRDDKYIKIKKLLHEHQDFKATERLYNLIREYIK